MTRKLFVSLTAGATALASLAGLSAGAQAANVDVSASVVAQCTLVANPLAFGTYVNGQSTAKNAQADVSYDCAQGLDITLNLSPGGSGDENARQMSSSSSGAFLQYQLYQDAARTTVWGSGASGVTVNPTPGGGPQSHTIFGQIPGGLGATAANDYTDTVVFDLAVN